MISLIELIEEVECDIRNVDIFQKNSDYSLMKE